MNIDPIQILEVTMYSKIVNESVSLVTKNNNYIYLGMLMFMLYKIIKVDYIKCAAENWLERWTNKEDEAVIIIPQHKRVFVTYCGSQTRESVQQLYSERFRAINHYLDKNHPENINKMIEISRRESISMWDAEVIDYLLLPIQNEKILIHREREIYFEISITEESKDQDDKKTKDAPSYKNYTYKLSKRGAGSFNILNQFLDDCILQYKNEILNKKEHSVFEYIKYKKDEEDKCDMIFRRYPFRSNKYLDKNIFFEGRGEFINYIDRFIKKSDPNEKSAIEQQYEHSGITFKAGIIMTGPPGCGKSSTIRGILNRTKRHGIVVRWSSINSCSEFCALLRSTKINDVVYEPGELCFIFEDFDANDDEVLKSRAHKNEIPTVFADKYSLASSCDDSNSELAKTKSALENMVMAMNQKKEDALTLECVLNTIDGIVELHDIMLIFTTNHLDKIDSAFTRPGRIDYVLNLGLASVETIREMIVHKYPGINISEYENRFESINGDAISPADIQITCLKYGEGEIEKCLDELVKKTAIINQFDS